MAIFSAISIVRYRNKKHHRIHSVRNPDTLFRHFSRKITIFAILSEIRTVFIT